MTQTKCPTCGNRYHWHHAFAKFGYNDPATYLPANIQNLLNTKLPPERLFSAPNISATRFQAD